MAEPPPKTPPNISGQNITVDPSSLISPRAFISTHGGGSITLGAECGVGDFAYVVSMGGDIVIGAQSGIQLFCILFGHGGVTIGKYVRIAPQTIIIASNHNFDRLDIPICRQGETSKGIVIEDDVWIGAGCKILDGVTIGQGSVIGAGSVVSRSIPPYSVAMGVPARVIRRRGEGKELEAADAHLLA